MSSYHMSSALLRLLYTLLIFSERWAHSWALPPSQLPPPKTNLNRRHLLSGAVGLWTAVLVAQQEMTVHAACFAGDESPECIGVYKVPIDTVDAVRSMPQAVQQNAPGLRPSPDSSSTSITGLPSTYADALKVLEAQRRAADDILEVVARGQLEEAGLKTLRLVPQVTAAGRLILAQLASSNSALTAGAKEVQLLRLQAALDETIACWGQVDVTLGQGLRGELGVVTVAQLAVLSDVRDATRAYDDFLAHVPPLQG